MAGAVSNRVQTMLSGTGTFRVTGAERREPSVPISLPETEWTYADTAW